MTDTIPKWMSISLDDPALRFLPTATIFDNGGKYVGLLTEMPSEEKPEGVEMVMFADTDGRLRDRRGKPVSLATGYQRQIVNARPDSAKIEWPKAHFPWPDIVGFGIYGQFQGGVLLFAAKLTLSIPVHTNESVYFSHDALKRVCMHGENLTLRATQEPSFIKGG